MASSSSSSASQPSKYDVFLNFRGEDTRRGFTSHLYAALRRKALQTFFDDDDLKRGEEIAQSLPRAIQDSTVAILVFSKDYASSSWCLDELAEIIERHRFHGQIVLPVFYEVNPSHLRKQSHNVAAAFVKHGQNPMNAEKIPRWKYALTKAADLSGFDSKEFRNDHLLISKIVEVILEKLNQSMPCDDFEHLVGMDSRIKEIKEEFTTNPSKARILGIWGMGGIGKTTTAEVIYEKMSRQFQDCCFVHDVRQRAEASGINKLQEEVILKVLGEKDSVKYTFNAGPDPFLKRILGRKKVLIVLDDVNNSRQIESLIGDPCWFSSGSMILITSRDKQVFKERADFIYEVKLLNDDEALQLFNKRAPFKQNYRRDESRLASLSRSLEESVRSLEESARSIVEYAKGNPRDDDAFASSSRSYAKGNPRDDYASLSKSIVKYANGNPLALNVLGSALNGKNRKVWEDALSQLSKVGNKDIQKVLQMGYDGLNRVEQAIFLDIACFFKLAGEMYVKEDITRKIYKNSEFSIDIMRKIYKGSGWDIGMILSVLADKCLIVISKYRLNMHDLLQEVGKEIVQQEANYSYQRSRLWDPQDIYEIFARSKEAEAVQTITLDLSKISKMNLNPEVFIKLPNLRFLNFYGKSNLHFFQGLDYLPDTLKYLRWDKYPLESLPPNYQPKNLVALQLPNSNIKQLWNRPKEDSLLSPDKYEIGDGFGRLRSLSAESKNTTHLDGSWRLRSPRLTENKSTTHLPNCRSGFSEALEVLNLRGCLNLNTFPEISDNIKELYLSETAINQVPSSSVELLNKLECLEMEDCKELKSLPSNFFSKLTSLCDLDLKGCSCFKMLPEISEATTRSVVLNLRETAIEKLPSFIGICNERWHIDMSNCSKLAFYPRSSENCFSEDIFWVESLYLSNCNLRELPEGLSFPSFIRYLDLSENDFERIPATFKQLSQLKSFDISNCKRLLSLPELPSNICRIFADNCRSLKEIWTLKQLSLDLQLTTYYFNLSNCLLLDEDECQEVVNALLRNYTRSQTQKSLAKFEMIYPGSRIPKWVKYQKMGDSIEIHLPSYAFNLLFRGFAFYLCLDKQPNGYMLRYDCNFGDNFHFSLDTSEEFCLRSVDKEHMVVFVTTRFCQRVLSHGNSGGDVAVFKFSSRPEDGIKECGVIPLYAQNDQDESYGTFDFPN